MCPAKLAGLPVADQCLLPTTFSCIPMFEGDVGPLQEACRISFLHIVFQGVLIPCRMDILLFFLHCFLGDVALLKEGYCFVSELGTEPL